MEIKELNSSIIKGIYCAYKDSKRFNGTINPYIKPEYLITVNIAKSISEDFDLIIKLEEPTEIFLKESADKLEILKHFHYIKDFKENREKLLRTGRIDIVLYDEKKKNVYPIEIKGFDSPMRNKQRLFDDINRLLLFMQDETGNSNIGFSTIAFIQEAKASFESEINDCLMKINQDYTSMLELVYSEYLEKFIFKVHTEIVFDNLFKSQEEIDSIPTYSTIDEIGLEESNDELGLFVGVIITFYKSNI